MKARRLERERWVLVFSRGDEVLSELLLFATREKISGASFQGIGAFERATLAFFDLAEKKYLPIRIEEQVEVTALTGNVARHGDELKIHAHAVVAGSDGGARGGHLLDGRVRPTLELFLTETPVPLQRREDEETGLPLLVLE